MAGVVTVEFGPSRSKRFGKALAEARSGAGQCSELEPGRYRVRFVLGTDAAAYINLARLLERVRHWRATEVCEGDEPASAYHAREMAWCASSQLKSFRDCRFRFSYGVFPRCSLCPLFDSERAIRDMLGENPLPPIVLEITYGPKLRALLRGTWTAWLGNPSRTGRSLTSRQKSGKSPRVETHQAEARSHALATAPDARRALARPSFFVHARARTIAERLELPCRSRDGVRELAVRGAQALVGLGVADDRLRGVRLVGTNEVDLDPLLDGRHA
jgi:hypothetical protein